MRRERLLIAISLVLLTIVLAACSNTSPVPATPTEVTLAIALPTVCPPAVAPACPAPPTTVVKEVPFQDEWIKSGHADAKAEAFIHWNKETPPQVPADCAKCHSTPGYLDFLNSPTGTVTAPSPIGTVITCTACHNEKTGALKSVQFPSGVVISALGPEARCMACHQGRSSTVQINATLDKNGLTKDLDKVEPKLAFQNIHYFAAAATQYGSAVKGGYEYDGKKYNVKFDHVAGYDTCSACHNPHSLEVKVDQCTACHQGVQAKEDLKNIRMAGSLRDYNGNGDTQEGIAKEIEGLQAMLLQAIQAYAKEKAGKAIAYSPASYPYFFLDTNGNGQVDTDEAKADNNFNAWTGRLLKAAYNYQTSIKDPGAFAHGAKYIIQLLYDSIDDLNQAVTAKVDLSKASRISAGHFAGSEEAFRHWDGEPGGMTPKECARCHSASGLPFYLAQGVNISARAANGLNCATCHDDLAKFTRRQVGAVAFPSGKQIDSGNADSNLCLNCHQGRESRVSIEAAIKKTGVQDDEVSKNLSFRNPHYFAAGATLFGTEAQGAYEYEGKTYVGRFKHVQAYSNCTQCHDTHSLQVRIDKCSTCHGAIKSAEALKDITNPGLTVDYAGDGNPNEGLGVQVGKIQEKLLTAMQAYASKTTKSGIVYAAASYPYFFIDTNDNSKADPDEINSKNAYTAWTPRLLRAAYNYQWSVKDPGVFAHNGKYIIQILYDSIENTGGDLTGLVRPGLPTPEATPTPTPVK